MRQHEKNQILEILQTLSEAHAVIKDYIAKDDFANAHGLLADCQQTAVGIGEFIENIEGETCLSVRRLEDYCERLYQISEDASKGLFSKQAVQMLDDSLEEMESSLETDIAIRLEVVFLPYKASMWDSLESVWKAADEDPACDAYVIPIPYYDKNPDGSFCQEHYEGDLYPDYVPITRYDEYDFQNRQPDMIFIHNPYDDCNYVTSVHPFFYSKNLKQYTKKLVYIPYFILYEINPMDWESIEKIQHFCTVPGVFYADKVIVQSEDMRKVYIDVLTRNAGKDTRKYWEDKIFGLGSPKTDKIFTTDIKELALPVAWQQIITHLDGRRKIVILYNTSVSALLEHGEKMIHKIREALECFYNHRKTVALLWRPHPLIRATLESMRPQLWQQYDEMVQRYRRDAWGIYDDTPQLDRAIALCDGYYGDFSSLVQLCQKAGKPIMIQQLREEETGDIK